MIGPRPGSAGDSAARSDGSTLPADLQHEQSIRVQLLYAVGAGLWALNFLMDAWLSPQGDRGPYHGRIEGLALACAAVTVLFVRYAPVGHRTKVDVGVAMMLPHAFALALMNSWMAQSTTVRPLSGVTILILFVGMLAPVRPRRMLAAGLAAAAMDPLAVWLAHLRGLPVPSPLHAIALFYPNFVCAVLAVTPAHLLYRLGRKIREARALGSYQLVERLGEGGMGEVWLARHRLLARSAAIKLIRPAMLTGGHSDRAIATITRFEREAQATAGLTSPNTIRLYDFGLTDDGTFYYVMELLDGRDLESLVGEFGPLPPARALYLLRQVCRSLGEAHAAGLIHRDVKPANIYVCRLGLEYDFVKVLDFGLVRHEDGAQGATLLTGDAGIVGTPAYMAPEAIVGGAIDRRTDVYALGCVAYFLLTGEPVFGHDRSLKQLLRHVQDRPEPPSRRAPHPVPRAVDDLVLACLRKDPVDRPQSADAVFEMAARCATDELWGEAEARRWWTTQSLRPGAVAPVSPSAVSTMAR
ncbi:MAG: serine/threonine-protein kinase [Vicinamibacterales bacterium]